MNLEGSTIPGPHFDNQCGNCLLPQGACVCPKTVDWGYIVANVGRLYQARNVTYDRNCNDWFDVVNIDGVVAFRIQHFFGLVTRFYFTEVSTLWMKQIHALKALNNLPTSEHDKFEYMTGENGDLFQCNFKPVAI